MKKASSYQEHAEQCRQLAANAKAEHKIMLLQMADTWEGLAKDRREQIERMERIKRLDSALK